MGVQQIAPLPNEKTTELFLRAVFDHKPEDARILIWTIPEKLTRTFTDVDQAIAYVGECVDHKDVYFGVGTGSIDPKATQRFLAKQITGLIGFHIDLDVEDEHAHKKKNLPPTKEAAMAFLDELVLPPTFVVDSGHGYQAHWLFDEPWSFENSAERDTAHQYNRWWQQFARGLALKNHAWNVDSTPDLSRVLRVPGSVNWKVPTQPVPVTIVRYDLGARYQINQFLKVLEDNQEIAKLPQKGFDTEVMRRELENSVKIDPNAEPPMLKFAKLLRNSRQAYSAFNHDHDQPSPSDEDFDLACAALKEMVDDDNGMMKRLWTEQEVVDLLIYHRRTYGYDLKHPGYYPLTVANALARIEKDNKLAEVNATLDDKVKILLEAKAQPNQGEFQPPFDDDGIDADDDEEVEEEEEEEGEGEVAADDRDEDDLSDLLDDDGSVHFSREELLRPSGKASGATAKVTSIATATKTATAKSKKAKGQKGESGIISIRPAFDTGDAEGEEARAAILKGLSDIYNPITFVDIIKLLSDPPQYRFIFNVKGKESSLTMKNLDAVVNMRQFRVAVGGATDRLMPQIKQQDWDKHVQAIMSAARPEEIGEEATDVGLVNAWLNGYVESATIDHDWDGEFVEDGNRTIVPYKDDYYLFMGDIQYWLKVHRNERTTAQQLGALFRARGMDFVKLPMTRGKSKSRTTKSAWWIPPSIMAPFLEAEKKYEI